jgi:hypothetical protein
LHVDYKESCFEVFRLGEFGGGSHGCGYDDFVKLEKWVMCVVMLELGYRMSNALLGSRTPREKE